MSELQPHYGVCPCCNGAIEIFVEPGKGNLKPYAGVISICSDCGELCVVEDDLTLVKMTDEQKEFVKNKAPDQYNKMLRISDHFRNRFANRQPTIFPPHSFSNN